jgi:5'-deoxynucleotidase YfbR-like HD superfamily hydrolase
MTTESMPTNAIQTHSGSYFDLHESGPDAIKIEDIAHSLAMQCRYNGHIRMFYSVAEHSVLVAGWVLEQTGDYQLALEALLHDGSEAYLCDIPRPFKRLLTDYKVLEQRVETLLSLAFGLIYPWAPIIHEADLRILADEKKVLMLHHREWPGMDGVKPLGVRIRGLSWQEAECAFLNAFQSITEKLNAKAPVN